MVLDVLLLEMFAKWPSIMFVNFFTIFIEIWIRFVIFFCLYNKFVSLLESWKRNINVLLVSWSLYILKILFTLKILFIMTILFVRVTWANVQVLCQLRIKLWQCIFCGGSKVFWLVCITSYNYFCVFKTNLFLGPFQTYMMNVFLRKYFHEKPHHRCLKKL